MKSVSLTNLAGIRLWVRPEHVAMVFQKPDEIGSCYIMFPSGAVERLDKSGTEVNELLFGG